MGESANGTRRVAGGFLGFIGYMLSPLSWWNDLFVNVPLALAFAWFVALFYQPAFMAAAVFGYWLTNVAGFLLMHKGASMAMSKESKPFSWRGFAIDIGVSLAYTVFIIALIKLKWVTPPEGLLRR